MTDTNSGRKPNNGRPMAKSASNGSDRSTENKPPSSSGQQQQQQQGGGGQRRGRGGHSHSASQSRRGGSRQEGSAAMNNLQHLIQGMKKGGSPDIAGTPPSDQADLAALSSRLSLQEDQLQAQLQSQLGSRGLSRSGSGPLPTVGEDGSVAPQPAGTRHGGPRFAGNAAFQSAVARHAGDAQQQQQQSAGGGYSRGTLAHQRQLSLQSRFADLGYNVNQGIPADLDEMTDDGSSTTTDFMGNGQFDPTRNHRRAGSEMPTSGGGYAGGLRMGHGHTASFGANPPQLQGTAASMYAAEQLALQQQIEMLQLQQQQLLQQQMGFQAPPQGRPNPPPSAAATARTTAHRRIQSHALQSGPMGSFSTGSGPMGSFGLQSQQQQQQQANVPRGHGRRHSVNVVNKSAAALPSPPPSAPAPQNDGPVMQANPSFSFPAHGPTSGAPAAAPQSQPASAPVRGHFSHPSVQLTSLPPEYLLAAGGLVSLGSLNLGGGMSDLADGFGGAGGGGAPRGHGRQGSQSWRINGPPAGQQPVDLAQAQAQLAQLHQLRATGGVAPTGPGFNNMSAFNQFNANFMGQQQHQQSQAQQRKALFGSYLPQASLPPLLAAGKLVVGILRVNKRNRSDAWVRTEVLDSDIFISGSKDRNRALDGDVVAVELLDPNEVWAVKKEKEDKKRRKEEQFASGLAGANAAALAARKPDKAKDDLEVEGGQLKLIEDEEENDSAPPALAGHVVAIVERAPGQLYSGTLGLLRPSSAATKEKQQAERAAREGGDGTQGQEPQPRPKIVWFRPTDKRVPLIAIPADQAPQDFWDEGSQEIYNSRLFMASLKRWPSTSLHPFGTLVEEVGAIGNVEAETTALLKNSLASATDEFSEAALKCLPPLPWAVPERELEVRRDMRSERVFTIDPATAKDLDDALSVTRLDDGKLEVGVHIADVSYFVKLGSALDRDARKRGTSVYLVQKALPMLPPTLSEELCSLVPHVERLCFSVIFTMDADARILDTWYGRTVIRSCAKLAYGDAQTVIDGGHIAEDRLGDKPSVSIADVESDILALHGLAQKMRARRFESGALRVDSVKLGFSLDEAGLPTDAITQQTGEANRLVEEFMLAANTAVAMRIAAGLPDQALLRRHETPIGRRLEGFQARAKQMGYDIDISSAGALHTSLRAIPDERKRMALESLVTKSMIRAKYVCCGLVDIAKLGHYALNQALYTHFTSPIRRYADVIAHRQLDAVLQGQDKFALDKESVAKIAQQCNVKRDAAKLAQEQSQHLFLCLMIHDLSLRYGPVIRTATVTGVLDAAFDVIIPEFGLEKRVHVDQMPIEHHVYDEHSTSLALYWKQGVDVIQWLADNSDDVHVKRMRDLQLSLELTSSRPHDDEAQLFEDEDEELTRVQHKISSGEDAEGSEQRQKSFRFDRSSNCVFDGVQLTSTGHRVQTVKALSQLSVVISSDVTKSPPVIKVFAVNPFA